MLSWTALRYRRRKMWSTPKKDVPSHAVGIECRTVEELIMGPRFRDNILLCRCSGGAVPLPTGSPAMVSV